MSETTTGEVISKDGTRIVFYSDRDGDNDIYSMKSDGTGVKRLTNSPGDDAFPAWSPDGTRIAFASNRDGNVELYTMDADGTNLVRLTDDPAEDSSPAWRPPAPTQ